MKFELSVALSYLLPRKGRLSQSVTALLAAFVISTIVWLTLVYFSTIGSIQERWTEKIEGVLGIYELVPREEYLHDPSSLLAQKKASFGYAIPRLSLQAQEEIPSWDEALDGPLDKELLPALNSKTPLARLIALLQNDKHSFIWHLFEQQVAHVQCLKDEETLSQYVVLRGMKATDSLAPLLMKTSQLEKEEKGRLIQMQKEVFPQRKEALIASSDELLPIPSLGYPLLFPIQARKQHIRLMDPIVIEQAQNGSSHALASLKGFVAGFYDPGILPIGSKLVLCSTEVISLLSPSLSLQEPLSASGIAITNSGGKTKKELLELLNQNGVDDFFTLRSYDEYPMTRELFDQLNNEKTLFQLLSSVLLFVASSNILSMLFIIARDRKKEIALFRALGLKRSSLILLFSCAGLFMGLLSLVVGYLLALLTLHFLPECLSAISWVQGRSVLDPALFGAIGREWVRPSTMLFSSFFVLLSSTLAGFIASFYATRIPMSEALKEP